MCFGLPAPPNGWWEQLDDDDFVAVCTLTADDEVVGKVAVHEGSASSIFLPGPLVRSRTPSTARTGRRRCGSPWPMEYEQILREQRGEVVLLTLNRPERLNAWTFRMSAELVDAIQAADADESVGAVVVTGAGRGLLRRRGHVGRLRLARRRPPRRRWRGRRTGGRLGGPRAADQADRRGGQRRGHRRRAHDGAAVRPHRRRPRAPSSACGSSRWAWCPSWRRRSCSRSAAGSARRRTWCCRAARSSGPRRRRSASPTSASPTTRCSTWRSSGPGPTPRTRRRSCAGSSSCSRRTPPTRTCGRCSAASSSASRRRTRRPSTARRWRPSWRSAHRCSARRR